MKKLSLYFLAAVFAFGAASCKKDWLDVNTNPNTPTSTTPQLIFTNAVNTFISNTALHQFGSNMAGQYSQSTSFIGGQPSQTYAISNTDFNFFTGFYNNLNDFQYVIDNATTDNTKHLGGFARVMKAFVYQRAVDLYGDIPYTEALKGTKGLQPKYDDDKFIYEDLIKVLDTAITNIKASSVNTDAADIVFGGNRTNWIKLANSLKLRLLMHQSYIPGRDGYIIGEINRAVAEGTGFLDAGLDASASPGYIAGSAGKINPFFAAFGYDQNFAQAQGVRLVKISQLVIEQFKTTSDTFRLKRAAAPAGGFSKAQIVANYKGVPYGGTGNAFLESLTSSVGPAIVNVTFDATGKITGGNQTMRVIIMQASEAYLHRAEAKQRYGAGVNLPLTAQQYYELGVRENFRLVGSTDAQATLLLTGGKANADFTASPDKLSAIQYQKYLTHLNFDGLEAWTEQRKSEIPPKPLSLQAATPTAPVRLFYPLVEESSNGINTPDNISIFTSKIFWDVN